MNYWSSYLALELEFKNINFVSKTKGIVQNSGAYKYSSFKSQTICTLTLWYLFYKMILERIHIFFCVWKNLLKRKNHKKFIFEIKIINITTSWILSKFVLRICSSNFSQKFISGNLPGDILTILHYFSYIILIALF